ncbi:MAG: 2Fe-2S iron-sulfur cluster binding domain-containing protein [Granulosicoccus sp.]|nr:2Fe-2S iron-sulfur cluster binding domain-containing protein [Granulosicoccus sp.]
MPNKYRVSFSNRDWPPLEVADDEAIIDAAEAAGHVLPIACRYGGCITCAARLLEGSVRQPKATALNGRQSRAGYILLCVARPKTDCHIEVGVESHGGLYENPFAKPNERSLEILKCLQSK